MRRIAAVVFAVAVGATAVFAGRAEHARAAVPALSSEPIVTVYGATWCSACKSLERGLRDRGVPFDLVDVDENPKAYDVAKRATGKNVVPLTSVARGTDDVAWIVGADVDAVEKAYRGE